MGEKRYIATDFLAHLAPIGPLVSLVLLDYHLPLTRERIVRQ